MDPKISKPFAQQGTPVVLLALLSQQLQWQASHSKSNGKAIGVQHKPSVNCANLAGGRGGTPWGYGSTCTGLSVAWRWWEAGLLGLLAGALQRPLPWHADLTALPEPAVIKSSLTPIETVLSGVKEEGLVVGLVDWLVGREGYAGGRRGEVCCV